MSDRRLTFLKCNRSRPCPICGKTSWCSVTVEGPVRCMKNPPLPAPTGWTMGDKPSVSIKGGGGDGWMFYPGGFDPKSVPQQTPEQLAERKDREEKLKARRKANALRWWKEAEKGPDRGPDHEVMRGYFEARGIHVDNLPGHRLPDCLRYHDACPDLWDKDRSTWISFPAVIAKIVDGKGDQVGIHRIFLDPDDLTRKRPESERFGEAKKKLGSSLGGCVRLCNGSKRGVLFIGEGIETMAAVLEVFGLATWSAVDAESMRAVEIPRALVEPGRHDSISTIIFCGDLDAKDTGQHAVSIAANKVRHEFPWLTVLARYPTSKCCPQLVAAGAPGTTSADHPKLGKSVDWKEVKAAAGADGVRAGLLDGVDLEANAARAFHWREQDRIAGQGGDPPENPPPPAAPPAPDDGEEAIDLVEDSPLLRSQCYLLENESPPFERRPRSGWYLRRWAGKWWEYDGRAWWELDDESLHGRVQQWLDRKYSIKRGAVKRLDPSGKMVEEVIKAARSECLVESEQMPAWTPATFDADGSPIWGLASMPRRQRQGFADRPLPEGLIPYSNCLLDSKAWTEKRLQVFNHNPRFFCANCLPFKLPAKTIRAALEADRLDELVRQMCPEWLKFLDKVSRGEAKWIMCLQEFMGYTLIHDVYTIQKILGLQGPPRSGKSTILRIHRYVLGPHNVASTSLKAMTERFGLSDLVGKLAAQLPDAHLGKFDDMTAAVENLKSISGGDPIRIEEKYAKRAPTILLTCRILMAFNKPPSLSDGSGAFSGRLIILPMQDSYLGQEDVGLYARLKAEAEGINLWMLQGLQRLMSMERPALTIPTSSEDANRDFADDSAPVQMYVEECCEWNEGAVETVDEHYIVWKSFCHRTGRQPGSRENLGKLLKGFYGGRIQIVQPTDANGERGRCYRGLRILDSARPSASQPLYGGPVDSTSSTPVWQQRLTTSVGAPPPGQAPYTPF